MSDHQLRARPLEWTGPTEVAMDPYWEAVRMKVCRKCIDGDGKGTCRLPVGEECALEAFFPVLVQTVTSVQGHAIGPYVEALRENVCSHCVHQLPDGTCRKRVTLECALDRYYPVVVEMIESLREVVQER
ncbi:MAG: hypothetical protein WD295_00610 [Bacteroidota bacterium]